MDISDLQKTWHALGEQDPLWAILSVEDKIDNRWDPAAFFKTGLVEIDDALRYIDSLKIALSKRRALDFGCGVGRLTQALCRHFDECCGVDIAPSMIDSARKYNQYGNRCTYHLNESDHLRAFENDSWDFIYSNIVLQHMKPEFSRNYIAEFVRILRPGGVLLFQIPAELVSASTPAAARLPDSAFMASITPHVTSVQAKPASRIHISATVRNVSSSYWPGATETPGNPISLGNHWISDKGELIVLDDARARLESGLRPNEETELYLVATAPAIPGDYIIELDMVQELVSWFGNKGSIVPRIPVSILGESPLSSTDPSCAGSMPRIEMYGIPAEEVLQTIAQAGGSVIDVRENSLAGLEWTSFSYCVTKS